MSGTVIYPAKKTFTITNNISKGTLSVTSSDESIVTASIDASKNPPVVTITPKIVTKTGQTATIIVRSEETDNYEVQTAEYKIRVDDIVPLGTVSVPVNGTKTLEQGWKYFCNDDKNIWLIYSNIMEVSAQQISGTIQGTSENSVISSLNRQDLIDYLNGTGSYVGKWNHIKTGIENALKAKGITLTEDQKAQIEVKGSPEV